MAEEVQEDIITVEVKNELQQKISDESFITDNVSLLYNAAHTPLLIQLIAALTSVAPDPSLIGNYFLLKNPQSFQACLSQVASSINKAYCIAEKTMIFLQGCTSDIPNDIIYILRILNQDHDDLKSQQLLKKYIKRIQDGTNGCKTKTYETECEFIKVLDILSELIEATLSTKSHNERETNEKKMQKEISIAKKNDREKNQKEHEEIFKCAEKTKNEANHDLKKQLHKNSALQDVLLATVVEGLCDAGKEFVSKKLLAVNISQSSPTQNTDTPVSATQSSLMQKLFEIAMYLKHTDNEATINGYITSLKTCEKPNFDLVEEIELITKAKEMQQFLEENGKNLGDEDVKTKMEEIKAATINSIKLYTKALNEQKKQQQNAKQTEMGYREALIKAQTEKTRITLENYQTESEKAEKIRKELNKNKEEFQNILLKIQMIDLKSPELMGYIKCLKDVLGYIGKVKENWTHLTRFFQRLDVMVSQMFAKRAESFVDEVEADFCQDNEIEKAINAIACCFTISNCTKIYTAISNKHIMPVIAAINFKFSTEEVEEIREDLTEKLKIMEDIVKQTVEDKQKEIQDKNTKQTLSILSQLKSATTIQD